MPNREIEAQLADLETDTGLEDLAETLFEPDRRASLPLSMAVERGFAKKAKRHRKKPRIDTVKAPR